MPYLVIAGQGAGKTYLVNSYLVPTLLSDPHRINPHAPADGYKLALIDDPARALTGAQYDGQRFNDSSEFRRASKRQRRCCFDRADPDALIKLALDCEGAVLVFDEMDKRFPSTSAPLVRERYTLAEEPRHYGLCTVGGVRSLRRVHVQIRSNCQGAWVGNLTEPEDQKYAADLIGAPRSFLERDDVRHFSALGRGCFVQWLRHDGRIILTKLKNGALTRT